MSKEKMKGISVKKDEDFSQWYTELIQKAELADIRYNVKGFVPYRAWASITIRKMYRKYEETLERKGHLPLIMPTLIPERNFKLEAKHVEGFSPGVFWVTHGGDKELEERLALRPTSETALYQMYSLWIRSYNDLPFKRYVSGQVFRYEQADTRPFFRAREFHWIESHDVFATEEEARQQVIEDMETTYEMLQEEFAIPIIFFQRPEWDKFPGAVHTYAADALMDSGKVLQLPSTHLLGQNFSIPFDVKFIDENNEEQYGYITCYGPAISRIYGAMIALLGDDNGLVLPWDLAPIQVVIIPIYRSDTKEDVLKKAKELEETLRKYLKETTIKLDDRDYVSPGEKFNEWELKGVPLRIEIGPKDIQNEQIVAVNRISGTKERVKLADLKEYSSSFASTFTKQLKEKYSVQFESQLELVNTVDEVKKAIGENKIVCTGFCSIDLDGEPCAEQIEKELKAFVRGIRVDPEKHKFEKCVVCGKPAKETIYIARSY
ncbi:MAG: proline--tRNA ligase [Candidatus Heimdallarchaeota archaeon]|nr:proline--tRNA ligase [Candidatus Heimdallarchaeota archaeon]